MVVGLGAASILEVGLTLHHVYGLPYFPASSFKGLVQSYELMRLAEKLEVKPLDAPAYKQRRKERRPTPMQMLEEMLTLDPNKEEERERMEELKKKLCSDEALAHDASIRQNSIDELADLGKDFRRVFGSTAREGEVIFFDAFPSPSQVPKLELDIMNPHYGPYYTDEKGEKPPADYYSPVPVYFLALKKGTRFRFRWASKDDHLLGCVKDWLKEAIKVFGVGAKTRAGYGELR
jgi:CRISPR-associated protein Cmr6